MNTKLSDPAPSAPVSRKTLDMHNSASHNGHNNMNGSISEGCTVSGEKRSICIVAPFPPPYGGMAIQAEKLSSALERDGRKIQRVATNQSFGRRTEWINRIPIVRTLFRTILFLYALNKSLHRCGLVYLFSGFYDYFFWVTAPAILLVKMRGKRIILSARGGMAVEFIRQHRLLMPLFIGLTDGITAPSDFLGNEFKQAFHAPVTLIPSITDIDQFRFIERSRFRPRLLCSRNLESMYNVDCSIKALARIKKLFPDATLYLAGDGSECDRLKNLCSSLGLDRDVTFLGQISHSKMEKVYADCDILINSPNVDNLPAAILEAFASGLPVVSTNAGGIPFLVRHETTGLLVEKDDDEGLAEAVVRLVQNPSFAREIVSNARDACKTSRKRGS